jgi:hypothetical protein
MVTPAARREAVAHLRVAYEVSERRACSALGADRTSIRYRSIRPDDAAVRARLRELAAIRQRFGYRRLHILLGREGIKMNHKKLRRLYREERLQVRRRGGRKRALGTRAPMTLPQGPNQLDSLIVSRGRQRHGADRHRDPALVTAGAGRMALHSRLASLSRMPSSRASTDDYATNCSTRRCSARSTMSARLLRSGRTTTTPSDRTVLSAICRQPRLPNSALPECNGTGRCAMSRAPRPVPLHHRANRAQMKPGLS